MRGPFDLHPLLLASVVILTGCASVKNAATGAAERATGREVADRVDRGVGAAADGAEDRVLGNGGSDNATDSTPRQVDESTATPSRSLAETSFYDFEPGERLLFQESFATDNMGDFPRGLKWHRGTLEVVELGGERFVRASSPNAAFSIPIDEALPARFTIEMDVYNPAAPYGLLMTTGELPSGRNGFRGEPHLQWAAPAFRGHGLIGADGSYLAVRTAEVDATRGMEKAPVTARVMVDDEHMKLYWGEQRIANVPQVDMPRGEAIHLVLEASPDQPIYVGNIRIAAGGRDLYAVLEREGRFTAKGIEFETGSDQIRPSSRATLDEIGSMLQQHADLSLAIEGHTDSEGTDLSNQVLSERRAASVRAYLIETYGVDSARLESVGFGESRPVAGNDTPEGRQENRRVELVRAEASPMRDSGTQRTSGREGGPPVSSGASSGTASLTVGGSETLFDLTYCRIGPRVSGQLTILAEATAVGTFRGKPAALFMAEAESSQADNIDLYLTELSDDKRAMPPLEASITILQEHGEYWGARGREIQADYAYEKLESLPPDQLPLAMQEMSQRLEANDKAMIDALPRARVFGTHSVEGSTFSFVGSGQTSLNPDMPAFEGLGGDVRVNVRCES